MSVSVAGKSVEVEVSTFCGTAEIKVAGVTGLAALVALLADGDRLGTLLFSPFWESERIMAKAIATASIPIAAMATMISFPMSRRINYPLALGLGVSQ